MKKTLKLSAVLMAFIIAIGMMASAIAATIGTVKLSSGSMTIRKTASTKATSVGTLKNGDKVTIVSSTGDWHKITYGKATGYVMKQYITSSSTATTTPAASRTGTVKTATKLYTTASTKSTALISLPKNAKITISSETSSYYKATYNKKTGYVLKSNVTASAVATKPTTQPPSNVVAPGSNVGYTSPELVAPKDPATTKLEVISAINYNIANIKTSFTVNVKNFSTDMIPGSTSAYEYAFLKGGFKSVTTGTEKDGITPVSFVMEYYPGGYVVSSYKNKTAVPSGNADAVALRSQVEGIMKDLKIENLSEYDKVVAIHDYVVKNVAYSVSNPNEMRNAFGVLKTKTANCQGYADTMAVLLTAAGIENRFVWAISKINQGGTHGFNKVKVNGTWYNVDATADDPSPNVVGRIKRDYLFVSDEIARQRYTWEESRYPAATSMKDNWHYKNAMVGDTTAKIETLLKQEVGKKQTQISIWVPKYSTTVGTELSKILGRAQKYPGVKTIKVSTTPAATSFKTWGTAVFFTVTY